MTFLTRNQRSRGAALRAASAVALAFLTGMAVRGFLADGHPATTAVTSEAAKAPSLNGPGPRQFIDGIPSGFARSDEGARAAAVMYVLSGQRLLELAPTQLGPAVRSMAATGSADAQIKDAEQQLRAVREVLAAGTGATRYLQAALASRVDAFTPERARVSVWSVGVLSRTGVAQPQAAWTTSIFELVWDRDDWKIWNETITAGPAPQLNAGAKPTTAEQLDLALNGFTPWRTQ